MDCAPNELNALRVSLKEWMNDEIDHIKGHYDECHVMITGQMGKYGVQY